MNEKIILGDPVQAHKRIAALWAKVKTALQSGERLQIEVKPLTRKLSQNAMFHALCSDIAASGTQWAGKPRTAAEWKVLLISGHAVATKQPTEIVPGLEGEFINVRESSALMTIGRASSLIEYTLAWCAQHGIRTDGYRAQVDTETGEVPA